nr:phosphate ABC transporter substrate-binding protein PstS family protein [Levilactobacillus bambusae]
MTAKTWRRLIIASVIGILTLTAYTTRQVGHAGESVTAVGSTALQPLIEAASEQYTSEHLGTFISVQGGGTGTGLSQIQEGAVEMGDSDLFAAEQKGIRANTLVDHKIAVVGITPIVNAKVGIKNISQADLIRVFTGKVSNWKQVGGRDVPVVILNRAQGSGTRATFEKWALNGQQSVASQEQDSSGMVRQIVASTPGAISYVAFSYVNGGVQPLSIDHVQPTDRNVTTNRWPIWSYEHVYTQKHPKPLTRQFVKYLESHEVQSTLVKQLGYLSPNEMKVERDAAGHVTEVK